MTPAYDGGGARTPSHGSSWDPSVINTPARSSHNDDFGAGDGFDNSGFGSSGFGASSASSGFGATSGGFGNSGFNSTPSQKGFFMF